MRSGLKESVKLATREVLKGLAVEEGVVDLVGKAKEGLEDKVWSRREDLKARRSGLRG